MRDCPELRGKGQNYENCKWDRWKGSNLLVRAISERDDRIMAEAVIKQDEFLDPKVDPNLKIKSKYHIPGKLLGKSSIPEYILITF